MKRAKKNGKRSRKRATTTHSPNAPVAETAAPRPRRKLPEAMRAVGLDELEVSGVLKCQVGALNQSDKLNARKLLLDYLKLSVNILDPPKRAATAEQPTNVELVHFVPRPDREEEKPPGTGT